LKPLYQVKKPKSPSFEEFGVPLPLPLPLPPLLPPPLPLPLPCRCRCQCNKCLLSHLAERSMGKMEKPPDVNTALNMQI
jgi:hypothetical protein